MVDVVGGIYNAGTVSVTHGSKIVSGTGTFWLAVGEILDEIWIDDRNSLVAAFNEDGELELALPWTGTDQVNAEYVLNLRSPLRYDPAITQGKVRDLIAFYKMGGIRGTRHVTSATDDITVDDLSKVITYDRPTPIAASLPAANTGGQFVDGWAARYKNEGVGLVSISSPSQINGSSDPFEIPQGATADIFVDNGAYGVVYNSDRDGTNGSDGATIITQASAPATTFPANSLWIDSDSVNLDVFRLTGSPLAWADTGIDLKGGQGAPGTNGTNGASGLTIVRAVATSNVAISSGLENGDVVDGVTLGTNDFVLLAGQTTAAENGVYQVVASGAASRAAAFSTYDSMPGCYFSVMEGTVSADKLYRCTSNKGGTLGATALAISEFSSGGGVLRGYIAGLTLSTAGSSATFGISAGVAADSTNSNMLALASAYTKTTGGWAVGSGNGSLDTGAIAANTWYHVYLIKRLDTGVVDPIISLSASAPTLPANYTQYRRIGSMRTNASSQWTKFIQDGDTFTWDLPGSDVVVTNPGATAVLRTLSVPLGVRVQALMVVSVDANPASNQAVGVYMSDPNATDWAVFYTGAVSFPSYASALGTGEFLTGGFVSCFTNTSSQIRTRLQNSQGGTQLVILTLGFIDLRGRNA